jgi:hypothetical protein
MIDGLRCMACGKRHMGTVNLYNPHGCDRKEVHAWYDKNVKRIKEGETTTMDININVARDER